MHNVVSSELAAASGRESDAASSRRYSGQILSECRPSWAQQQERSRQIDAKSPDESEFGDATASAWFGTHGTHISRAIVQRNGAEYMAEVVIGADDRVRIHNTERYPYSAICSLEITSSTGRRFVGSGWLASGSTVITAGHCVYLPDEGGWAKRVRVYPGRNGPDGGNSFLGTRLVSVEGWTSDRRPAADYGAIVLNESADDSGSFGYLALKENDLKKNIYHVVGYSADKPLGTLWGHVRPLSAVREDILYYETDTYGGNSGCPVFFVDDEDPQAIYVVGIHNYGDLSGNSATRITTEVFDNISDWNS